MTASKDRLACVTGATGFIGRHLALRLLDEGYQLKLLARDPVKLDLKLHRECEIYQGDLSDSAALNAAVENVQFVFHCAADTRTWGHWSEYYQSNVAGVQNLLEAILASAPNIQRLLHLSTVDVYDYPRLPVDETFVADAIRFNYGRSKAEGEQRVTTFCTEHQIPYTIFRPCNVIGPGSPFITKIGQRLRKGIMLEIDGGAANAGLLSVDNLTTYMVRALDREETLGECFNICDKSDINWHQYNQWLRQALKGRGVIINLPYWLADNLAKMIEFGYRIVGARSEPFLHGLLVQMFGRTCGHQSEKIEQLCGTVSPVDVEPLLQAACRMDLAAG